MEEALEQFVDLLMSLIASGPLGLGLAIVIVIVITVFRYSGLVKSGNMARVVVALLSIGLPGGEFSDGETWVPRILTAVFSTLIFTWSEAGSAAVAAKKNS